VGPGQDVVTSTTDYARPSSIKYHESEPESATRPGVRRPRCSVPRSSSMSPAGGVPDWVLPPGRGRRQVLSGWPGPCPPSPPSRCLGAEDIEDVSVFPDEAEEVHRPRIRGTLHLACPGVYRPGRATAPFIESVDPGPGPCLEMLRCNPLIAKLLMNRFVRRAALSEDLTRV
jgi:hypothetical protein